VRFLHSKKLTALRVLPALVILLALLVTSLNNNVLAESGSSTSYILDYARFTNDSDQKTSANYALLDSISDISVEGNSSNYQLRNIYADITNSTTPAVCGNGVIETGESCEGSNFQGFSCNSYGYQLGSLQCVNCQIVTDQCFNPNNSGGGGGGNFSCGNGIREAGEQCDDGNNNNGDGCSTGCRIEYAVCGNGITDLGEECDDGNVNTGDGCTPMCILEVDIDEQPKEEPEKQLPELVFNPYFDPELEYPNLDINIGIELQAPLEKEETNISAIRPSASTAYDYHFDRSNTNNTVNTERITILDETVFITTSAPANKLYELVIFDKNKNPVVRQGVQSSPEGIVMVEAIPFLKYENYQVQLINDKHEIFKEWPITIEDRKYRMHDTLMVGKEINHEYIELGNFQKTESIMGIGKPGTTYFSYIQKLKKKEGQVTSIQFIKTKADENGVYVINPPTNLDYGTYIMHIVQVYKDGKVSRNKRFIFNIENKTQNHTSIWVIISICLITLIGRYKLKKRKYKSKKKTIKAILSLIALASLSSYILPAQAVSTTPNVFIYEGKLLNSSGTPIISTQNFRLSLWSTDDKVAGDIDGTGNINVLAPSYSGWFETHTVTPNTDGTFFLELGSITPLPDMDFSIHKHLMVEVKTAGLPNTSYELMDPTGDAGVDGDDRQTIGSTPYTNNADFLDNAEIGNTFGDLVTLDIGDVWNISTIPGGTYKDTFTLDTDNTTVPGDSIELIFGNTLAESLSFDISNDWFELSNDLNLNKNEIKDFAIDNLAIAPIAPVTGQIYHNTSNGNTYIWNGIIWEDITESTSPDMEDVYINDANKEMDILDVRGITFNMNTVGDYLIDLQNTGDLVIADNGTNFAVFTDDGNFGIGNTMPSSVFHADSNDVNTEAIITLENTAGDFQVFRTDSTPETAIIASIGDLAIDSNNGTAYIKNTGIGTNSGWIQFAGTKEKQIIFQTEYKNATIEDDGSNNKGLLHARFIDNGGTSKHNYYEWTSRKANMQDIDIVISYILPEDFISFTSTPLSVLYQTSDGVVTTNKLDLNIYDSTGSAVTLTGGSNLANATWTNKNITFTGTPVFTAGDTITLAIKLSTTNAGYAKVSDVILNYNGT